MCYRILVLAYVLTCAGFTQANTSEIPKDLQDWTAWVTEDHPELTCPINDRKGQYDCTWVSTTALSVQPKHLDFTIHVTTFSPGWIYLPGKDSLWPQNVISQEQGSVLKPLPVRRSQGRPQVHLQAGEHTIHGKIHYQKIPPNLQVPQNSGLITLKINGKKVTRPEIDSNGELWLDRGKTEKKEVIRNTEEIQVYRLIKDENPTKLITRIILNISGEPREIQTGPFLLDNFIPLSLKSSLPARIENNKNLRVQVKPGRWVIELTARYKGPLSSLQYDSALPSWPSSEVWSFQADRSLRSVQISGPNSVDPNQTNLPAEWKSFPAYKINPGQTLTLNEVQRGDPTRESDDLTIKRNLYLDFMGEGFTTSDAISGQVKKSWRLDSSTDLALGSAELNGLSQLITKSKDGETQGIEIRQGQLNIKAVGRHEGLGSMNISGWQQLFSNVSTTLHLPPGWSLFATSGVDTANHSWISQWNLLDIFLVAIIVVAVYRMCGVIPGSIALITMLFLYHREGAPLFIWLNIVAVLALIKVTEGKLKTNLGLYQALSFFSLILIILPFSIDQIRQSIYPQLKHPDIAQVHQQQNIYNKEQAYEGREYDMAMPSISSSLEDENSYMKKRGKLSRAKSKFSSYSSAKTEYDPNAIVQTGPGLPSWHWETAELSWNGPVTENETMSLYLVPPWLNRIGFIVSALLSVLFGAVLFMQSNLLSVLSNFRVNSLKNKLALLPIVFLSTLALNLPETAQASVNIDSKILEELESRLTEKPECIPDCTSIEYVDLKTEKNRLTITMNVDALESSAFGLPAWKKTWLPHSVKTKNKDAIIKFSPNGQLLIQLDKGRNNIVLTGKILTQQVELNFGSPVHNITTHTKGYESNGILDGYASTGSIQLLRLAQLSKKQDALLPDPIPPYVIVTRRLNLGLEWRVSTRVHRVAPSLGALSITLPLLDGESPLSTLERTGNQVKVNFAPNQRDIIWESVLKKQDVIHLTATDKYHWSEIWSVEASPVWHLEFDGIAPVKKANSTLHTPIWMPWPGEKISLSVSRPVAEKGESLTIDFLDLQHQLGQRTNHSTLEFNVRTSQGQYYPFTLPDGATLDSMLIDQSSQALVQTTGEIAIPLHPGKQVIQLKWHSDSGVKLKSELPKIQLIKNTTNIRSTILLPRDRWVLFVGGPAFGPAILLWGWMIVVVLVAFVLGKIAITPLKFHHWLLLGLGVTSTNFYTPLLIVGWLFAIGLRGKYSGYLKAKNFRLIQFALFGFSVIALGSLLITIPMGLLSSPEMHIVGNGSSAYSLNWYQDRMGDTFPNAWVVSVPIYVYRIAMLAWSLWLAVSLLNWLKWAWIQISTKGIWNFEDEGQAEINKQENAKED